MDNDIYDQYSLLEEALDTQIRRLDKKKLEGIDITEDLKTLYTAYTVEMVRLDSRSILNK